MAYQIWVFDKSGNKVAYLDNAFKKHRTEKMNYAPSLSFSLPADDAKSSYLTSAYDAKVWNTRKERWEGLYLLDTKEEVWDGSGSQIDCEYSGVMAQLAEEDNISYDTTSTPVSPTTIVTALLALQEQTPAITVGTIEPTTNFSLSIENGNLLGALLKCTEYLGGYIEVNADRELNWYDEPSGAIMRELRYKKNLKGVSRKQDYTKIINKLYAYGWGETEAQVDLTDAGEANEYIEDTTSQSAYGVKILRITDERIRHPATLLKWAQRILADRKDPIFYYKVDVTNLAENTAYNFDLENLEVGQRVRVVNSDMADLSVNTLLVSVDLDLDYPENVDIELVNITPDISYSFGDVQSYQSLIQNQAVQIGAGQVTVQGVFTVDGWRSAGTTTIDGGQITADTITATQIAAGTITATEITAGTITGDKIAVNTIDVDSLKTSTLNAKTITLGTTGGDAIIKSGNYLAGTAGWQIEANGDAEFNNVTVRGTLGASTIGAGETITISGDIKTSDGKFEIKTTGVTLKQTAADTTYLSLIQDSAQIQMHYLGDQRVQITPTGTIRLDTSAGIPIKIVSTSADDCVDISTAVFNKRAIVAVSTPGATSTGTATIHATNSTSGGYAVYGSGKIGASGEINADGGFVTIGSSDFRALKVTGNLTMAGTANISDVATITATTLKSNSLSPASGSTITVSADLSMSTYNITCDDITCDDVTLDRIKSASGKIEVDASMLFSSGSYGLHFNNDGTNTVLYSNGTNLYFRDSGGTTHTIV